MLIVFLALDWGEILTGPSVSGMGVLLLISAFVGYLSDTVGSLNSNHMQRNEFVKSQTSALEGRIQNLQQELAELKKIEAELKVASEALEQSTYAKRHFLANISHELRTPLTMIIGQADALYEAVYGDLNEEQLVATQQILQSGDYLTKLLDRILDFSRFNSENVSLQLELISVELISLAAIQMVAEQAQQKEVQIDFDNQAGGINIEADEVYLMQILINLLENAVKFTPSNQKIGLIVEYNDRQATQSEKGTQMLSFSVWDTGIGMASEQIDSAFEAFVKLEKGTEGTGLGLSLVKQIVELHQGSIHVDSQLGKGSRFTVCLPLQQPDIPNRTIYENMTQG
ncbi:MAG: HAMP domain-containing sensor histidine kinase [Chloroflexota bacterium]